MSCLGCLYICPLNDLIEIFLYCHRSVPGLFLNAQNSQSTSVCICASLLCSAAWSSLGKHKAKMFQQHVFVSCHICVKSCLILQLTCDGVGHYWIGPQLMSHLTFIGKRFWINEMGSFMQGQDEIALVKSDLLIHLILHTRRGLKPFPYKTILKFKYLSLKMLDLGSQLSFRSACS